MSLKSWSRFFSCPALQRAATGRFDHKLRRLAPSEEFSDLVVFEFDALNCPRIDWHSNSSWSA